MTWSTQSIVKVFYVGRNGKKSHVEKVVYRLSRLCRISTEGTVNVTQNGTVNIIITSGGNGGNPNAIIFLFLKEMVQLEGYLMIKYI